MQLDNLFTENFQLIVYRRHPLARHEMISLDEILEYPIILHDNGFSTNEFYQNYLTTPKKMLVLFKSNNSRTLLSALRKTSALFLTTDFLSNKDYSNYNDLHISPVKNLEVEYFSLYKKDTATECAIREIISLLKFIHIKSIIV